MSKGNDIHRGSLIAFLSVFLVAAVAATGCTAERAEAGDSRVQDEAAAAAAAEQIAFREATEREQRQLRVIRLHLEDLRANVRSIREKLREGEHFDAEEHADEMYGLVQQARMAAVDVPGDKGELILRDLSDLQHAVDELKDVAAQATEHTEIEHALDSVDQGIARLEADIS